MSGKFKYHFVLQAIVLIWGLTGILGDYIKFDPQSSGHSMVESIKVVFFRTAIAATSLFLISFFVRNVQKINFLQMIQLMGVGFIVAAHWFSFFYAIKVSTVSIGVVCMATMAFFTSLLEPLFLKRKVYASEIFLSIFSLSGMALIFGFEFRYAEGIIWGLICALLSTVFTIINSRLTRSYNAVTITRFEMLGATLSSAVVLLGIGEVKEGFMDIGAINWIYLLILGIVCTTVAFLAGVWVIRYVSPFTFGISINLEPVYTILIVLLIDYIQGTEKEKMTTGFYVGGLVILAAVLLNAYGA